MKNFRFGGYLSDEILLSSYRSRDVLNWYAAPLRSRRRRVGAKVCFLIHTLDIARVGAKTIQNEIRS
jgi:hypothetical protein